MQVVENDRHRLLRACGAQECGERLEQPEPGVGGIGHRRRKIGHDLAKFGQNRREIGPTPSDPRPHDVRIELAESRAQRLHPGPVGRGAARLPAAAHQDAGAPPSGVRRHLLGQAALADSRLAGEQEEAGAPGVRRLDPRQQRGELLLAPDEGPVGGLGRGLDVGDEVEGRVLLEDRLLELAQIAPRLQPELLDERDARLAVGVQRLGLTARAIEGEHELAAQRLAQAMLADERLELAHHLGVASRRQVAFDALLQA